MFQRRRSSCRHISRQPANMVSASSWCRPSQGPEAVGFTVAGPVPGGERPRSRRSCRLRRRRAGRWRRPRRRAGQHRRTAGRSSPRRCDRRGSGADPAPFEQPRQHVVASWCIDGAAAPAGGAAVAVPGEHEELDVAGVAQDPGGELPPQADEPSPSWRKTSGGPPGPWAGTWRYSRGPGPTSTVGNGGAVSRARCRRWRRTTRTLRVAADVVDQGEGPVGVDLALRGGFTAQLQPALEQHPQARRADRVAEGLQAAVGVHRQLPVEVEPAGEELLAGGAPVGEAEVLDEDELRRREAVVHLGEGELAARVGDAGLRVGVSGGGDDLGERRVVVAGVERARAVAGDERQALHVQRRVGVLERSVGGDEHRGGRAVGDTGAVEEAEHPGDRRCPFDRLLGHLGPELGAGVAGTVGVVLPGDRGEHVTHLAGVEAIASAVGGGEEREHGGDARLRRGAVGGHRRQVDAGIGRVLQLLDTDRHDPVVGPGRHGEAGVAERLRAGRAEVLDPGDGPVRDLQRVGEGQTAEPGVEIPSSTPRCPPGRRRRRRRRRTRRRRRGRRRPCPSARRTGCSPSRRSRPCPGCQYPSAEPPQRTCLPEVVVDPVCAVQPAERHLDPGADLDGRGVHVSELALHAAAAVEVDDPEHRRRVREAASQSTVNVATVPIASAKDTWSASSTARQPAQTRCGGRWRWPQARHRLPARPNFQPACRHDGGAAGASASGRRPGSRGRSRATSGTSCTRCSPGPVEERRDRLTRSAVPAVAPVARKDTSAPSSRTTRATTWPRVAVSRAEARRRPA